MRRETTDVLVVGAGPAGLIASALLSRAKISSLTVTKYASTAESPRAHIVNQRSNEVFRDLGIDQRVMANATPQHRMAIQPFATSFAGREIRRGLRERSGLFARVQTLADHSSHSDSFTVEGRRRGQRSYAPKRSLVPAFTPILVRLTRRGRAR